MNAYNKTILENFYNVFRRLHLCSMGDKMIKKALDTLRIMQEEQKAIEAINQSLEKIDKGDFPCRINCITSNLETAIVSILDDILSPDAGKDYGIASYLLYDGGGMLTVDGKEYPIKTADDIEVFVNAMNGK